MKRSLLLLLSSVVWVACSKGSDDSPLLLADAESTGDVAEQAADAETEADAGTADVAEEPDVIEADTAGPPVAEIPSQIRFMVSTLAFPAADDDGRVPGFDLDGSLESGQEKVCGQSDFEDPDGKGGVDNQVSILTPLFDLVGVGQIHQYLQESIDSSGFFLLFDVSDVDSLEDDDEVSLVFEVGGGNGLMGRNGQLVPNQTMCVQEDSPSTSADAAWIESGVLYARFSELTILISRFERVYPLTLRGAMVKATLGENGQSVSAGVVGGALSLDELMTLVIKMAQNQSNLVETVEPLLAGMGDMPVGDNECGAMSVGLVFDAIPVFFYPPEIECDPCGNGVCDTFESCETCLADCCPGCGNGQCDYYPTDSYEVSIGASGFSDPTMQRLVGDEVRWMNESGEVLNLVCEGLFSSKQVAVDETVAFTLQSSGEYKCRTFEQVGQTMTITAADNHSEDCQSCPQDCGDCP